jgi:hypothetical protein
MTGCMQCPASMCPLVAKDGSPWTGQYGAPCPGHDDLEKDGCAWWSMACSGGGIQIQVDEAARHEGRAAVAGPNKPRRGIGSPRDYDCPKANVCRWQEQAEVSGRHLCPPRDALSRGLDPRVCLF